MLRSTDLSGLATARGTLGACQRGKVRDVYRLGHELVLVTTDRLSAFDRVLTEVPAKGQVLNQLAAWWFEQVSDLVAHHVIAVPDPNVTIGRVCRPLPVEVVVRGFLTGVTTTALWPRYEAGERVLYGIGLPDGLHRDDPLPHAIVTPTTKALAGAHDEPLSNAEVVSRGLVGADRWEEVMHAALAVFERGQHLAAEAGLTLVDTKYEFGLDEAGTLTLIDEVHTPDSSRYWKATIGGEHASASVPTAVRESYDKELVRIWYAERGYRGDGEPPTLPATVIAELSQRYIDVYERLTRAQFAPAVEPAEPRIRRNLLAWAASRADRDC